MYLKMYKKYWAALSCLLWVTSSINAQTDSLFLTVDQLFERGVQYNLQLQADAMKESMAQERMRTARSAQLPELQIGLKGGICRTTRRLGTGIIRSCLSGSTGLVTKLCN